MKAFFPDKIRQYGFKRLLLAVSGGLDSICLAHYFVENRELLGIEWLGIAHVHHGLREKTADRDAAFVENFAKSHNVPFFLKKLDGESLKEMEGSLEENAREARYKALLEIVQDCSETQDDTSLTPHYPSVIVTAHHAGDQAETMYMRLRRGTTLAGLRGIQEVRNTPHYVYRPFLNVSRKELIDYARENKLEWCEDESNSDVKFTRNKIRREFLPKLEQQYPGATDQLCKIAELADKAYEKVMDTCKGVFGEVMQDRDCFPMKQVQGRNDRSLDPSTRLSRIEPVPDLFRDSGTQDDTSLVSRLSSFVLLDKKKMRKVLIAHENADISEMFRLWLSEKGLRFPIGFFYDPRQPACVKIPHHAVYRRRAIVKNGHTVQICEFSTTEEAEKFVSCDKKDKGL